MKDFAAEIRAHLDVEHFLSQAQLMLDLPETNMEQILNRMLHNLLDGEEPPSAFVEASKALFTHRSGPTRRLLRHTVISHLYLYIKYSHIKRSSSVNRK